MGLRGPWEASQLLPRPEKPGFLSNPKLSVPNLSLFNLSLFDLSLFNLSLFDLSLFNLSLFGLSLFSQQSKDSSRGQQSPRV